MPVEYLGAQLEPRIRNKFPYRKYQSELDLKLDLFWFEIFRGL